jgi:type III restriction enzyme
MSDPNPILNNPYEEPDRHYATNQAGELDYEDVRPGRRIFSPDILSIPLPQGPQADLYEINDLTGQYGNHLVNLVRKEVGSWRSIGWPGTTRVTRELLTFWFANPERADMHQLFFAQREAIETAIWLNEVAAKSNPGQHILGQLAAAATGVSSSREDQLPRIAFKMATGTGKTVVMACLILYHFFNRREYRNDTRFADNFLVVAPGITIRDRLGVLRVDPRGATSADYYTARWLVPPPWRGDLKELNARLAITNFHSFQPRTLQGNKKSPFDGKVGPDGKKRSADEDPTQTIGRILGHFRPGSRCLVLNDEAHHCYLPKSDNRVADGEDAGEENKRAAVWFSGLREIARRLKLVSVYDLSATPFYLTGSGYEPYKLFPWVVSDFGLIEAIESGLVKIPFLPTSDDALTMDMPVLRNLYQHVRERLPRAGQRTQRRRAAEQGVAQREAPPDLPDLVKQALEQFYGHYREEWKNRAHSAGKADRSQLELEDTPPVFIAVCNNTSVSKEVFKYIAGYEIPGPDPEDPPTVIPGQFDLFSNFDPSTGKARQRPPTLLIDSDALENSGQIDDSFKKVFASEIANYKRDYARLHGQGEAEKISEAEMLREVVNTVGKPGTLGAHIRCVVSVSMLTEGWDANTVTHIMGLRAFNSQLLCEQVAGRALRRRSYYLQGYDKAGKATSDKRRIVNYRFPPEYAHIIGVPFRLFKGGSSRPLDPVPTVRIHALAEREPLEITFPQVTGYRIEFPEGPLVADFDRLPDYIIDGTRLPTKTILSTAISAERQELTVESILERREQEIHYLIAKNLLRDHFHDNEGNPRFDRFLELREIVARWYEEKVRVLGKDPAWKKLLWFHDPKPMVEHVAKLVIPPGPVHEVIRPILNHYNPTSSTRFVHGHTSKETTPTRHSHVNLVVQDSGWEGLAALALDQLASEGHILSWVKNSFLGFRIPYVDKTGKERDYMPDFLVRSPATAERPPVTLIIEVTGMERDKAEKKWCVENRWLPAVNSIAPRHGWGHWQFLELAGENEVRDLRNRVLAALASTPAS